MRKTVFVVFVFVSTWLTGQEVELPDSSLNQVSDVPIVVLSDSDEGVDQAQDVSGLLQSSDDVFVSTASFVFFPSWFKIRGYDSENYSVYVNGLHMNDPEIGRPTWNTWGGLNDATRNKELVSGIGLSEFGFGNIGGATNINFRPSLMRKGTRITYSNTNRSYRQRAMFYHNTGLMENNTAICFSASRRWANEGYEPGTFYDAWGYFLALEKKINDKHSLSLSVVGAPNSRGKKGVTTEETVELAGTNYYNPYWGYQDGEKRNSRVKHTDYPLFVLSHDWKIKDKTSLTTSAALNIGKGGEKALTWNDAQDPRPDYYRTLPSYYLNPEDEEDFLGLAENIAYWSGDEPPQIQWDDFYQANSKNLDLVENANGSGEDISGNRSIYMIEDRRHDVQTITFSSIYNNQLSDRVKVIAGINGKIHKGHHFKVVEDLLGGDFWLDVDKFAETNPSNPGIEDNDIETPNKVVYEGGVFGYDYIANINKFNFFEQTAVSLKKIDLYFGVDLSYTSFWRTGNIANGKFPEHSKGDSEKNNFLDYAGKAGLTYKITGRHYIVANGSYLTRAPFFRDAYISPRTRDHVIDGLESEKVFTGDISYMLRHPNFKARITGYYTKFQDRIFNRSFYHDDLRTFVNYMMTGVDMQNQGVELGIDAKVTQSLSIQGVAAYGEHIYTSRPSVSISEDNNNQTLVEDRMVYFKNYRLPNGPQTAYSIGPKYNSSKFWFAGINFNFFDQIYVSPNPERRTEEALSAFEASDPQVNQILEQEQLPSYFTLNFYGYKSWKIGEYYIGLYIAIDNLLNDQEIVTGGFEQLRYSSDYANINPDGSVKYPNKYFYMKGRTFFVNVNLRF